jgi:hypothetical protein
LKCGDCRINNPFLVFSILNVDHLLCGFADDCLEVKCLGSGRILLDTLAHQS